MPDLPAPPGGARFRRFAGAADYPELNTVFNRAHQADGILIHSTLDEFVNHYTHLTNCDLASDLLIVEDGEGTAGYGRVTWWIEEATDVRVLLHVGWLLPRLRGHGVYETMVEWSEGRLAEIAAAEPHAGVETLVTYVDDAETERGEVLAARGYLPTEYYADMTRSLDVPIVDAELPEGLTVRPVTWDDARAIFEHDAEAFRDHVGYTPKTEKDYERWINDPTSDPALWQVAFEGDEIVGQVLNFINAEENAQFDRRRGYTEYISTRRDWRGCGVARALITRSMRMFRDIGMTEAALGVHTTNPTGAFSLYEGLGYQVVRMSREMRKPYTGP